MMLPSILLLQATTVAALAAGNPLALRDPAPLPSGPLLDKLLFENPIVLGGLLLLAAAVVFVLLNNRGRLKHATGLALLLALLGAAVFIIANAVETDREKMATRTRKLIGAVSRAEIAQVEAMLDESCRLSAPLITSLSDKRAIVQLVQSNFAPGGVRTIKEAAVLEIQASKDGPDVGRTQVKVRATGMNGGISLSWWRLDFQKAGEGQWSVVGIEALDIGGL